VEVVMGVGKVVVLGMCPRCHRTTYDIVDEDDPWLVGWLGFIKTRGLYPCMWCEKCGGTRRRYSLLARLRYLLWRKVDLRPLPR